MGPSQRLQAPAKRIREPRPDWTSPTLIRTPFASPPLVTEVRGGVTVQDFAVKAVGNRQ